MMVRAKLPGGIATPAQLDALADVAETLRAAARATSRRARTCSSTSCRRPRPRTRCACSPTPASRRRKRAATRCATGRAARSPASPKDEPFDPTPYVEALARHLLRGKYSSTLPRKLKPSLGGCCGTDCSQAFINDLGFLARERATAQPGFKLVAGGGLSTLRRSALTVEEFVPVAEILEAADAVVRVFHRIGNRNNKAKARLKWAIDKIGATRSSPSTAPSARRSAPKAACRSCCRRSPSPPPRRAPLAQVAQLEPGYAEWAADTCARRSRPGSPRSSIRLILGDITVGAAPRARDARRRSTARARSALTNEQNLVLRCVPDARLPSLHRELVAHRPREGRREHARRRHELPRRVELQARGHRVARPRRRAHRAARPPPRSRRRGEGPRHQGLRLPARLRPALHRRHRLPGRHAQARRPPGAAVPRLRRRRHRRRPRRLRPADRQGPRAPRRRDARAPARLLHRRGRHGHAFWATVPTDELQAR